MRSEVFDLLVVGGGVTGCGVALDAATRGMSVALVEMRDWAAGTSSRSGKLIHGGLRYLERLDLALVREALRERALLLQVLCPHLVRPVRFLYPLRHRYWERPYVGAGLVLYDTLGGAGAVPRHRHLSRSAALDLAPSLRSEGLAGAITFFDAQVDDARHTMMLARTAASHGVAAATGLAVTAILRESGRVCGAQVRDAEDGDVFEVRARHVIGAVGVWTGRLTAMAGAPASLAVQASKGVHLLVPRDAIASGAAILARAEDSVIFIRPWGEHWLIGTTDTPWCHDLAHPAASAADIEYLLRNVNRVLERPLVRDDVEGVYAGLRPLVSGSAGMTSKLSREHCVLTVAPGFTVVAGGKYTTYRVMAAGAVDAALASDGRRATASRTAELPLVGANGWEALTQRRTALAATSGVPAAAIDRLLGRYGSLTGDLLALIADRPELGMPIPGGGGALRAEASYAASHEGALHLDDVLVRRTHVAVETRDRGMLAATTVAPLIAEVLGWSSATVAAELDRYRERAEAERRSQTMPDDATADSARGAARDPRLVGLRGV
jgi:glycerol-3-phosphate dehydrogenase